MAKINFVKIIMFDYTLLSIIISQIKHNITFIDVYLCDKLDL